MVEGRAGGVHQGVAELATLVDAARRLHADVARNPTRAGELTHEAGQPGDVGGHRRVELAVGALEVGVRQHCGPAVPGPVT